MNILPFLHFFAFLVYSYLLIFLLWKDTKSLLNRVCAAFLACFALWSFMLIFLYIPGTLKNTAILFDNIASIGWVGLGSFFLWFALIFAEKKKVLETKLFYFLVFILPLLLIYKKWTGFLTVDYIEQSCGWVGIWSDSIWPYLFYFYYLSFTGIGLYLIYNFGRKTKEPSKINQAKIIFITALISLILSTLVEVVFPELEIVKLPSLANVITLIWASGLVYAIVKYKFMVITPVVAAEKIISTMTDALILLDIEGNVAAINEAMLDLSRYQEDELKGKSVEIFFREKDFKSFLLDKAIKKEAIRNYEVFFKTKAGDNITVLFSSFTISNEIGDLIGIVCIIKDITSRKKAEETLRQSQEEANSLFQNSPLAGVYHDENGLILNVNYKFTKLFGYSLKEIKGRNINEGMIFPDDKTIDESKYLTQLTIAGKDIEYETIRKKKDGTLVPVIITVASIIRQEEKKKVIAFYQDRTIYKEALEKITESEKKYRTLFDNMPVAYYQSDNKGNMLIMNPAGVKLLEFQSLDEIIGKNLARELYYRPEDRKKFLELLENKQGKIKDYEVVLKNKNGKSVIVSTNSQYYYNEAGDIAGVEGIFVDITERKRNEKIQEVLNYIAKIANSSISLSRLYRIIHQQLGTLVDATNFYIALLNREENKVYFPYNTNKNKCEYQPRSFSQHSLNTMVLNTGKSFLVTSDMIKEDAHFQKYKEWFGSFRKAWLGVPLNIKEETIGALVVQNYSDPDCYSRKDILLLEFISSQISIAIKRKLDEEALRKSQQEFANLFRNNPEATVYTDEKGNVINVNSRFTELFGYSLAEMKGNNIDSGLIQPPDLIGEAKELTQKGISKDYVGIETVRKKKDGTIVPVYISASPIIVNNSPKGTIAVYYDISERKEAEEQLRRLVRVDTLTGCYNRRYGLELLDRQIKLSHRNQSSLLLAFLDIDNFKDINDKYGHSEGDILLKQVARLFDRTFREVDIVCRLGGDEFLIIFPDSSLIEAPLIRERLKENILQLNSERKKDFQLKISMGFSEYLPNKPESLDELISIADQRMYEEKRKNKKN